MNELTMMDPNMQQAFYTGGIIVNIISLLFYISFCYGLFLINKKLGEKHAWLSFVPLLQIYNYFTASKKSFLYYFVLPFIALIVGMVLAIFTFGISLIAAYIYFLVMWVMLVHAISKRVGRGAWTTVGFLLIGFFMYPYVGIKMDDQSAEKLVEVEKTENQNSEL